MPITTTLNRIRAHDPCAEGWRKLLAHLGKTKADDEPLPFEVILASNGLDDALWCCRAEPQHSREWRLFAVSCARSVQHLMTDKRCTAAIDVADRHASGEASDDELAAALAAARAAAWAAAWDAAWDAAWAAAMDAAWAAAMDAACDAACDAAMDATRAAACDATRAAACDATRAAAMDAARDAARDEMASKFLAIVSADVAAGS